MKKVTKEFEVYEYDELSESVKTRLLEEELNYLEKLYCDSFLSNDMEEKARELLKGEFGEFAEFILIRYDLGYCQGDGAVIEFKYTDNNCLSFEVKNYGRYTHENSFIVEFYESPNDYDELDELEDRIRLINIKLKDYGYKMIEGSKDKEFAIERLKDNEYLKSGEVF
jgi:hypothetical protein